MRRGPSGKSGSKARADQLLVDRGLAESRTKAQALVLAGLVFMGERRVEKPGEALPREAPLVVKGRDHPWVSRGGVKLAYAFDRFAISVEGKPALDIGAATGGFTEVLLARGARRVYAVDVGYGQLAYSLREDPRVVVLERHNARYLTPAEIPEPIAFLTVDASFIGLGTLLPAPLALCAAGAELVALVKPQFEAGPEHVGKGGVVRDPAIHRQVCEGVARFLEEKGWSVLGLVESPIQGPAGNREFLLYARAPRERL